MNSQRIHLIGVGGVGMAGLAVLLKNRSFEVSGCDTSGAKRLTWLESKGVKVYNSHDISHLDGIDNVVATPAVPLTVPERSAAKNLRMRGEVLAEMVSEASDSIAVSGSHGKTTTCTFIIRMLLELGEKVEWAVGGETGEFPLAGGEKGGVLVVEADESDATLELYKPKLLVITNVDYDHPDKFPTVESYQACFNVARGNAEKVIEGEGLTNEEIALKVLLSRGYALADAQKALKKISTQLPDRRFQKLTDGIYADYAHHPAEIRYCLKQARTISKGKIRVLFQPHRYSRTKRFLDEFATAFDLADEVVLCPVYPAFEEPIEGGTTADIHKRMCDLGRKAHLATSCDEAWEYASNSHRENDVMLVMGAGDIIKIASRVKAENHISSEIIESQTSVPRSVR